MKRLFWIRVVVTAVLALVFTLGCENKPLKSSDSADRPAMKPIDEPTLESEKDHLKWLEAEFSKRETTSRRLLNNPSWSKQAPFLADTLSDAKKSHAKWTDRCTQMSTLGDTKRLGLCTTAMIFAESGFETEVDCLDHQVPIKREVVLDWLTKLPDQRQGTRSLVHEKIPNRGEQERLYAELERSGKYEDRGRYLFEHGDYYGSWILITHSDNIRAAVFAEVVDPGANSETTTTETGN
jgi:hypothetical protein